MTNDGCSERGTEAVSCKQHSALIYVNKFINSSSTSPSGTGEAITDAAAGGGGNMHEPRRGCDWRGVCTAESPGGRGCTLPVQTQLGAEGDLLSRAYLHPLWSELQARHLGAEIQFLEAQVSSGK